MFPELLFRPSFLASWPPVLSLAFLYISLEFDTAISILPLAEEVGRAKLKLIIVQQRVPSTIKVITADLILVE